MERALSTDLPHARFWHRTAAHARPDDCGAFAALRCLSGTQRGIVLTEAPAGTGRAHFVGALASMMLSRLHAGASPGGALTIADRAVRTALQRPYPMTVSAFVGVLDPPSETLLYALAGSEFAFILNALGSIRTLHVTGPALGSGKPRFDVRRVSLRRGEMLVAVTLGLPGTDAAFGIAEIVAVARAALNERTNPADAIVDAAWRRRLTDDGGCAAVVTTVELHAA